MVDGCPPCIPININDIQEELNRRRPGQSSITTPRNEKDFIEILSGIDNNNNLTLGTPIAMIVRNTDFIKTDYDNNNNYYRPSHADATYDNKYFIKSSSGGGRASARETIGRVVAGNTYFMSCL